MGTCDEQVAALQTARIDNWYAHRMGARVCLVGLVSGHPKVNGGNVRTGWLERVEGELAYSRNTCWTLGPVGNWDVLRRIFSVEAADTEG